MEWEYVAVAAATMKARVEQTLLQPTPGIIDDVIGLIAPEERGKLCETARGSSTSVACGRNVSQHTQDPAGKDLLGIGAIELGWEFNEGSRRARLMVPLQDILLHEPWTRTVRGDDIAEGAAKSLCAQGKDGTLHAELQLKLQYIFHSFTTFFFSSSKHTFTNLCL